MGGENLPFLYTMIDLKKIFNKKDGVVIGAIHFPPLNGYPDFPGLDVALDNALKDLASFEEGGVDAVIIENNYDIPHKIFVDEEVRNSLLYLSKKIKSKAKIPVGISVLWNDYKTALSISKEAGLSFIRVPVYVDEIEAECGVITPQANNIDVYRKEISAENIALFTDIHVKHSKLLSTHSIVESAKLAIESGSSALIITGNWTGEAPDLDDLKKIREEVEDFPILCGSGVDSSNVTSLFEYANGAIVSTSLKSGSSKEGEVNVKGYSQRIDTELVKELISKIDTHG